MPDIRVIESLTGLGRDTWARLFPGALEDYDYLLAVEMAGLAGFRWRYILADEKGEVVAAAPAFLTEYALETTLAAPGRRMVEGVRRVLPEAFTLRLACLGSPCTETAMAGFAPGIGRDRRASLLGALLAGFERAAAEARCGLLGIKDITADEEALWATAARPLGYRPVASLPTATLDIDFPDIDAYLDRLSPGTRKDMRRKLRALDKVRIEIRADVDEVMDQVMALYRQTRARAEMALEDLTPAFFQGVAARMQGRAAYVLYFEGETLLAVNLLLQDGEVLLDKFFCMDAARGRPLNLYFLSWFTNVRLALERGCRRYQSGQAGYENKLRLGSRLTRTTNYFRHRNAILNTGLRLAAPLFAADPVSEKAA